MREGPSVDFIISETFRSCLKCKYFSNRQMSPGPFPVYRQDCIHHAVLSDFKVDEQKYVGNLGESGLTPDWCPVAPEGRFKKSNDQ